jgi:thioredoxin reductase
VAIGKSASRYGRLVDRKPSGPAGIMYHDLVNAVRKQIPANVPHIATKVAGITADVGRPLVTLATGEAISAKIVILATGQTQMVMCDQPRDSKSLPFDQHRL